MALNLLKSLNEDRKKSHVRETRAAVNLAIDRFEMYLTDNNSLKASVVDDTYVYDIGRSFHHDIFNGVEINLATITRDWCSVKYTVTCIQKLAEAEGLVVSSIDILQMIITMRSFGNTAKIQIPTNVGNLYPEKNKPILSQLNMSLRPNAPLIQQLNLKTMPVGSKKVKQQLQ